MFSDLHEFFRTLLLVWRVLTVVAVGQLIGGLIGIWGARYGSAFIDFWVGGIVATPVAFTIGLAWHLFEPERHTPEHRRMLYFLALLAFLLPVFAWVAPFGNLTG